MKKILGIVVLSLLWCGTANAGDDKICARVVNKAYADVLKEYPNDKKHFYVVMGDDGRCEYGHGLDAKSGFNNCEKHRKENDINGECKLFAIGKEIILKIDPDLLIAEAGCIEGNCTNGKGTMKWSNGDKYTGEWKKGEMHGVGTFTWSGGTKYTGDWKFGLENGKGRLAWSDGTIYIGERYNSKAEGQGTMILTNGDKYVGEWKNDKKHGIGKMFYNFGYSFKARWENNILVEKISKDQASNIEALWNETEKSAVKKKFIFNYWDSLPKIIKKKDPTTFKELKFIKKAENMNFFHRVSNNQNDKSSSIKTISGDVYIFKAIYEENYGHDGIRFMVNADFKSFKKAEKVALKYARYIGQLPAFLREKGFLHIYIHPQDRRWFATRSKNIFTIYNGSTKSAHYIVATLIHEAAHLATDLSLVNDPLWKKAFDADDKHITKYARTNRWEDAAESVLFWIAFRCGKKVSNKFKKKVVTGIPNRLKYLDEQGYDTYPLVCN